MARLFLLPVRRLRLARTLASPAARNRSPASDVAISASAFFSRSYISEMRRSAFKENILRILRSEITYEAESHPPSPPATRFESFSVDDRPGEQWIQLRRSHGGEEIKIDATMFDGAAPKTKSAETVDNASDARLHISLMVEVSKGEASNCVLQFSCSAWPDALDVEKVFPVQHGSVALKPYMGPDFKEFDEEVQQAVLNYLEQRGVNEDLAGFLHNYMENKDKTELLRWLKNVEAYIKRK